MEVVNGVVIIHMDDVSSDSNVSRLMVHARHTV
jgi:hypothetical protein